MRRESLRMALDPHKIAGKYRRCCLPTGKGMARSQSAYDRVAALCCMVVVGLLWNVVEWYRSSPPCTVVSQVGIGPTRRERIEHLMLG